MGAISFFIFFFTLLVLARQVSHPVQPSRASHICDLVFLTLSLNLTSPGLSPNGVPIGSF